jgi:hypothetical protein
VEASRGFSMSDPKISKTRYYKIMLGKASSQITDAISKSAMWELVGLLTVRLWIVLTIIIPL